MEFASISELIEKAETSGNAGMYKVPVTLRWKIKDDKNDSAECIECKAMTSLEVGNTVLCMSCFCKYLAEGAKEVFGKDCTIQSKPYRDLKRADVKTLMMHSALLTGLPARLRFAEEEPEVEGEPTEICSFDGLHQPCLCFWGRPIERVSVGTE